MLAVLAAAVLACRCGPFRVTGAVAHHTPSRPGFTSTRTDHGRSGASGGTPSDETCTSSPNGAIRFLYPSIVNSNGYNTYVDQDMWAANAGTTQTTCAANPGSWTVTANAGSSYTGVQTYPNVQQLFTDWSQADWAPADSAVAAAAGQGPTLEQTTRAEVADAKQQVSQVSQVITMALEGIGWNQGSNMTSTPLSALTSLSSTYATTNPSVGDFEAAYDIWLENTPDTEVMIWVYNVHRGTGGAAVAGHTTLFGGPVTLLHDSGSNEIILSLDSNRASGTIDILAALTYLQAQGLVSPTAALGQIDFGWEICNTAGQNLTFAVRSYSITASAG